MEEEKSQKEEIPFYKKENPTEQERKDTISVCYKIIFIHIGFYWIAYAFSVWFTALISTDGESASRWIIKVPLLLAYLLFTGLYFKDAAKFYTHSQFMREQLRFIFRYDDVAFEKKGMSITFISIAEPFKWWLWVAIIVYTVIYSIKNIIA